MELNREQIIKALECCVKAETHLDCRKLKCPALINDKCIYICETDEDCDRQQLADALALITSQEQRIKELTEENERLRCVGIPDYEVYIRLSDAKHAIMDYIGEQTVSKYVSEAECKAARGGAEGAMNELDYLTPAQVAPIADTVRKIQKRLKAKAYTNNYGQDVVLLSNIDQIAKEMLEEGK